MKGPMQWIRWMMILCRMRVKRMGDIRSECEEDEGNDCEDGNSDTDW